MNLRRKGSVSQAKIPLEWADVRSAGQVPAECGCEGGRKGVWGQGEETHVSICGNGSGHTRPGPVSSSDSKTVHSISFHSTRLTPHLEDAVVQPACQVPAPSCPTPFTPTYE